MNKYIVIFNTFKNKILFVFERCEHDDNNVLISKNFYFLSTILFQFFIDTRCLKFIIKNELNENKFDINFLKNILNRKRFI